MCDVLNDPPAKMLQKLREMANNPRKC